MIVISFIYSAFTGKTEETLTALFDTGRKTFEFVISVGGTMALWSGFMNIAEKSKLTDRLSSAFAPLISLIFNNVKKNSPASKAISMNMIANFLGLANAATPFGIKAMQELKLIHKGDGASDDMCMLAIINSASIQLIPSTIIAMRSAAGSVNPSGIILPVWIASLVTAITGIICAKLCSGAKSL